MSTETKIMHVLSPAELRELLRKAYMEGFDSSGEGWNGEMAGDGRKVRRDCADAALRIERAQR